MKISPCHLSISLCTKKNSSSVSPPRLRVKSSLSSGVVGQKRRRARTCEFPTEMIMDAQNFNFALNFFQNGFFSPKWTKKFSTKNFPRFLDSTKFREVVRVIASQHHCPYAGITGRDQSVLTPVTERAGLQASRRNHIVITLAARSLSHSS